MRTLSHFIIICFSLLFIAIAISTTAQGAMQEGESVWRGLDNTSRTGSTAITVNFDAEGNATLERKEVARNESDVVTFFLFVPSEEVVARGSQIELEMNEGGRYWMVDFGKGSSSQVNNNTMELSCICTEGGGSCNMVHVQQGDSQQTYCEAQSGCANCRLTVNNASNTYNNTVLLLKANSVSFQ